MGMAACGGLFPAFSASFLVYFGLQGRFDQADFYVIVAISTLVFSFGLAGLPGTAYYAATNTFIASGVEFEKPGALSTSI
jgi:L-cystine uptake protein TcyP (sodium:dicarboxylate symporter family)